MARNGSRRKYRRQRRYGLKRRVGVPELIGFVAKRKAVIFRHDFAVIADRGQDDEVRASAERADLGHLRRPETARERKLALAADLLIAKQQNRMLLERATHRCIDRIVGGDIGERHAANFGGEARTQRDDVHWIILRKFLVCLIFPQKRRAGKEMPGAAKPAGVAIRDRRDPRTCRPSSPDLRARSVPADARSAHAASSPHRSAAPRLFSD